jgi:hypothetical protein
MSESKVEVKITSNAMKTPESHEEIQSQHLRTYPALAKCPSGHVGFSRVERSINWLNCLFCCCCNCCWSGFMLYKWKDMSCCNAKHSCSECGTALAEYDAMK